MATVEKGFLSSFYTHFDKSTASIKRRSDLKALKSTLDTTIERNGTWVLSSSFATCESEAATFLMVLNDAGLHIINQRTHSHTLLDYSGHFQSKIGTLSIPVSISIIEQDFFAWISLHKKSMILHCTAKSRRIPKTSIKEQDLFATKGLASFGIELETPLTSSAKIQNSIVPIEAFISTLSTSKATESVESPNEEVFHSKTKRFIEKEVSTDIILKKPAETKKQHASYLLPTDIESFVKTEKIRVGDVNCQFNCLLDLSLAFHHSNGLKRLSSIMEVLFLGIPCRQEKGEIIREPISSKWNEVTKALQTLSQTIYTLKNTLDIENAQKILAQIPIMETAERSRLLEFSKAAYGFVSWYRSAFNFSLAQQDIWENLQDVLINAPIPAPASLNNDMPIQQTPVVTPERKTTKTYKKKETTEIRPSKIEKQLQPAKHEPVFANALTIPAPRIISLRKMI